MEWSLHPQQQTHTIPSLRRQGKLYQWKSQSGKLVLSIDNTASRKKKLVVYRFKVTAAPGAVVTTAEL
jgi:hypothetical protein